MDRVVELIPVRDRSACELREGFPHGVEGSAVGMQVHGVAVDHVDAGAVRRRRSLNVLLPFWGSRSDRLIMGRCRKEATGEQDRGRGWVGGSDWTLDSGGNGPG
jgi:hypothetical protein